MHEAITGHAGLPSTKETDFFTRNFERGLDWYLDFFRQCPPGRPMGEIDPNYFGEEIAAERIAAMIPQCAIIVTLRDPVARAWSSYRAMRRDAWTRASFEDTVRSNPIIRESSRYAHHLANWRAHFGTDRVLVMLYDDLERDPQAYLDRVCAFIGLAPIPVRGTALAAGRINAVTRAPRNRKLAQNARNARDWMRLHRWTRAIRLLDSLGVWRFAFGGGRPFGEIDPAIDARLRERFRPEVEALEAIIGRDLSAWKRPRAKSAGADSSTAARRAAAADRA